MAQSCEALHGTSLLAESQVQHLYSPLDESKKEIRLLLLHSRGTSSTPDHDMIRCSLRCTPIKTAPRFTALSYVWGTATRVSAIILNGRPFGTTQNLYNALQYLRKRDEDVWIWADALCINQEDVDERSLQVAMMRTIFRCAAYVLVSLGEYEEGVDAVMDFIEAAAQDELLHWDPSNSPHITIHGLDASSQPMQEYIARFFSMPWWHRVWTVQEYCVARKVYFRYGDRLISNKTVKNCLDNYWGHRAVCCRGFEHYGKPMDGAISVTECIQRLDVLSAYRRTRYPHYLRTISDFRYRHCFNPLDKIYGIIGLLDRSVRVLIRPDYTRSPREVYADVALAVAASTKTLDMLSFIYGDRTQDLNIPSFAPDWTTHVDHRWQGILRTREQEIRLYDASYGSFQDLCSIETDEVTASGIYIDTVKTLASGLGDWKPLIATVRKLSDIDNDIKTAYADKMTAFWQTLCGGLVWDDNLNEAKTEPGFRLVDATDFALYQRWQETIDTEPAEGSGHGSVYNFQRAVDMVSALRTFVITEKGYIGWVPKAAQQGDIVVLLSGGKVPYVLKNWELRAKIAPEMEDSFPDDKSMAQSRFSRFVGDAYIHGVMQGEHFDENKLETIRLI